MIKPSTYEAVLIKLRKDLIKHTGLDPKLVLNADTLFGADIRKFISDTISEAPSNSQSFIVFEFIETRDTAYGVGTDDLLAQVIAPYTFRIKIYGGQAHLLAQKLQAMYHLAPIVEDMENNGIKIVAIESPISTNDFINGSRWLRCDIEVRMLCNFQFDFSEAASAAPIAESVDDIFTREITRDGN